MLRTMNIFFFVYHHARYSLDTLTITENRGRVNIISYNRFFTCPPRDIAAILGQPPHSLLECAFTITLTESQKSLENRCASIYFT